MNRKWAGGACLVWEEPKRQDLKRQSIKNKLENGTNTSWQPADKLMPKEPVLSNENKEQLLAEIPQPDKIETPAMPEPKVVDSIVPPSPFKKKKPSASPIFYIQTSGTVGIGSLRMKILTIPSIPVNNHSRDL